MNEQEEEGLIIVPALDGPYVALWADELPDPDKQPQEWDDVRELLRAELPPFSIWMKLAVAYYRRGNLDGCRDIIGTLMEGLREHDNVREHYMVSYTDKQQGTKDLFGEEHVQLYNTLAALATRKAMAAPADSPERQQEVQMAKELLDDADAVKRFAEVTLLNNGWTRLNLDRDSWHHAGDFFESADKTAKEKGKEGNLMAKVGMGIIAYLKKEDYHKARRFFGTVLRAYPDCPASIRVGFGLCCYKLGQLDRAKASFKRALALEPGNKEALLALSRLELIEAPDAEAYAQKMDKSIKMQTAAYLQDPNDATAINSLATYYLHKWFNLPPTFQARVEPGSPVVHIEGTSTLQGHLQVSNYIRVGTTFASQIQEITGTRLTLKHPYHGPAGKFPLYKKHYDKVDKLAERAFALTDLNEIKAESFYLRARVAHMLGNTTVALNLYKEACGIWPDLAPAQYGLAQMLAHIGKTLECQGPAHMPEARANYDKAIEALEKALDKVPNDPDALHLLGLMYAEKTKGSDKAAALERLKNASTKETWIALAQVHQRDPPDLEAALKAYQNAEELMHKTPGERVPAILHNNVGVVKHQLGDLVEAKQRYLLALQIFADDLEKNPGVEAHRSLKSQLVHPTNRMFWEWVPVGNLQVSINKGSCQATVEGGDWTEDLKPGDHIRLGPVFVTEVDQPGEGDTTLLPLKHTFILPTLQGVGLYKKVTRPLLQAATLTTTFNLALVNLELGELGAAKELLHAIIEAYPTYTAPYIKLGSLAQAQHELKKAHEYFQKAKEADPEDTDVLAMNGKFLQEQQHFSQAQDVFMDLNNRDGDSYAMIALGHMYYRNIANKESHIVHASNFFSKALKKEGRNVQAANGIALILAEKGELEDARRLWLKVRESAPKHLLHDVLINLGHAHVVQGNRIAGQLCYETQWKNTIGASVLSGGAKGLDHRVMHYLANAYHLDQKYDKAVRALLTAIHVSPGEPQLYYNLSLSLENGSLKGFQRVQNRETQTESEALLAELDAKLALSLLERSEVQAVNQKGATKHHSFVEQLLSRAETFIRFDRDRLQKDEQARLQHRQQAEAARLKAEERAKAEEEEREKKEAERLAKAQEQEERLKTISSKWTSPMPSSQGSGKKKKKNQDGEQDELDESDVDEPEEGPAKGAKRRKGAKGKRGAGDESSEEEDKADGYQDSEDEEGAGAKRKAEGDEDVGTGVVKKRRVQRVRDDSDEEEEAELEFGAETTASMEVDNDNKESAGTSSKPRRRMMTDDSDDDEEASLGESTNKKATSEGATTESQPPKSYQDEMNDIFGSDDDDD